MGRAGENHVLVAPVGACCARAAAWRQWMATHTAMSGVQALPAPACGQHVASERHAAPSPTQLPVAPGALRRARGSRRQRHAAWWQRVDGSLPPPPPAAAPPAAADCRPCLSSLLPLQVR